MLINKIHKVNKYVTENFRYKLRNNNFRTMKENPKNNTSSFALKQNFTYQLDLLLENRQIHHIIAPKNDCYVK